MEYTCDLKKEVVKIITNKTQKEKEFDTGVKNDYSAVVLDPKKNP